MTTPNQEMVMNNDTADMGNMKVHITSNVEFQPIVLKSLSLPQFSIRSISLSLSLSLSPSPPPPSLPHYTPHWPH